MSSLAALRQSNKGLVNKFKESNAKEQSGVSRANDDRYWKPTFNKEKGSGSAVIRFLPVCEAETGDLPCIKIHSHAFRGATGKWYIEKSLSSIGRKDDPVGLLNSALWNSGVDSDKEHARTQKRQTKYYANILVIKDPANPANEGKVKIFEFGPSIYKIIQEKMTPEQIEGDDYIEPVNIFDIDTGADLAIRMVGHKMKNSQGQDTVVPNYDKSEFKASTPLCGGDDAKIEKVWSQCHPLRPLVDPTQFKSVEALQARLVEVLGPVVGSGIATIPGTTHRVQAEYENKPVQHTPRPAPTPAPVEDVAVDYDDSGLDFLKDI